MHDLAISVMISEHSFFPLYLACLVFSVQNLLLACLAISYAASVVSACCMPRKKEKGWGSASFSLDGRRASRPSHAEPEARKEDHGSSQPLDKWSRWLIDRHGQMPSRPSVPLRRRLFKGTDERRHPINSCCWEPCLV